MDFDYNAYETGFGFDDDDDDDGMIVMTPVSHSKPVSGDAEHSIQTSTVSESSNAGSSVGDGARSWEHVTGAPGPPLGRGRGRGTQRQNVNSSPGHSGESEVSGKGDVKSRVPGGRPPGRGRTTQEKLEALDRAIQTENVGKIRSLLSKGAHFT